MHCAVVKKEGHGRTLSCQNICSGKVQLLPCGQCHTTLERALAARLSVQSATASQSGKSALVQLFDGLPHLLALAILLGSCHFNTLAASKALLAAENAMYSLTRATLHLHLLQSSGTAHAELNPADCKAEAVVICLRSC